MAEKQESNQVVASLLPVSPTVPTGIVTVVILLAAAGVCLGLTWLAGAWLGVVMVAAIDGFFATLILVAAGGFGSVFVRRLAPPEAPAGLRAVTSAGVGCWVLSTLVVSLGSLIDGGLSAWRWWVVIAAGVLLAAVAVARHLASLSGEQRLVKGTEATLTRWKLPLRVKRDKLWLAVPAIAAGLWLAGAACAPGLVGLHGDSYDILEYHLQLPREFLQQGAVSTLEHNVYSHYPLGQEMLSLLAMILRGGAYEGMYAGKLLHGAMGALAVATLWLGWGRESTRHRRRFAAVLLAACPFVIYLSWVAMVELAQVFALALAAVWLRGWLRRPSWRSAAMIGLACGFACGTKYLAVGFVAAPVLLAMAVSAVLRGAGCCNPPAPSTGEATDEADSQTPKRPCPGCGLANVLLAGLLAAAMMGPWLIRNHAATGNPVFPLLTKQLGRGHWDTESQQRWIAGHGPQKQPPVPTPAAYVPEVPPSRTELLVRNFLSVDGMQWFGIVTFPLALLGIGVGAARAGKWGLFVPCLTIIAACQVALWAAFTQGLPPRFLVPIVVPLALLAAEGVRGMQVVLGSVAREKADADRARTETTLQKVLDAGGTVVVMLGAMAGLAHALEVYPAATRNLHLHGLEGRDLATNIAPYQIAHEVLPEDSTLLLVGSATPFYYPPGTQYATAFDAHPLAQLARSGATPAKIIRRLRHRGITHLWIHWGEIERLSRTYGYPAVLQRRPPGSALPTLLGKLGRVGLRRVGSLGADNTFRLAPNDGVIPATLTVYALPPSPPATSPAEPEQ
ncbi:MAG: ArnT family glycosyltransferase [Phycisphaerae bacterium]